MNNIHNYHTILHYSPILGRLSNDHDGKRHQTKGLMSKTKAVHVRYKSLYISLPSSAKQERDISLVK